MKKKHSQDFVKFTDRVFLAALVLQVFLLCGLAFAGLSTMFWLSSRAGEEVIESNFLTWENRLTEAVYRNQITGFWLWEELPEVREFEQALRLSGQSVEVSVSECESTSDILKPLTLGYLPLNRCVVIARSYEEISRQAGLISLFALASVVISIFFWWLWRGRLRRRYVQPLVASLEKEAKDAALGKMASQIAHDIRSPLAALNIFLRDAHSMPEEKRDLLRSAVHRIHDIANNLLPKRKGLFVTQDGPQIELVSSLLDRLVTEKRIQYRRNRKIEIHFKLARSAYAAFAKLESSSFLRAVSNLIDNAVEAIEAEEGQISVSLRCQPDSLIVLVEDNGRGIPSDKLHRVFQRGVSYQKPGGSGLGLSYAKEVVEACDGQLGILSKPGKGTRVSIRLPKASDPAWFLSSIQIWDGMRVAIADDDSSIHRIWDGRFRSFRAEELGVELKHFWSLSELDHWKLEDLDFQSFDLFLMDYEFFGESKTGLDWLKDNRLVDRAILVTSRFEEAALQAQAERLGLKVLPKGLSAYVPFEHKAQAWFKKEEQSRER
ncbi:MAG: sensor histidine kinase [Bradymonadales bacterium]|nr:MAG: sensor histidine kinase [Bradymonadales bacterium]